MTFNNKCRVCGFMCIDISENTPISNLFAQKNQSLSVCMYLLTIEMKNQLRSPIELCSMASNDLFLLKNTQTQQH